MDNQLSRPLKKKSFPIKKIGRVLLLVLLVLIPVLVISRLFKKPNTSASSDSAQVAGAAAEGVLASAPIGVEVPIPVNDNRGNEIGVLTMSVSSAELRDEIIVKGKTAKAIDGRDFLLINLKINNPMDKGIQINTRDFFRLAANGSPEWLAPEIHNDPVEVQALSTKITRVGFPINETDTNIILQIGLLDGEKQQVPLTF